MEERKRDEILSDIDDVKTSIETVRHVRPPERDEILDGAVKSLSDIAEAIESSESAE